MSTEHASVTVLTVDEICKLTGIKDRKVRGLIKSGFFKRAAIPGRQIYVRQEDFERAMRVQETSSDI